jgi:DNA-directed RNA polymerase specialized sigma subunit
MPYECFYTLPKRIEDRRIIWRIDEQLRSHIEVLSEHFSSDSQIAYYLLKQLQQHPEELLLQKHWHSFLFRRCEKVAIAILRRIPTVSYSCSFSDLFNMGFEIVNNPVEFFKNFNEQYSSSWNLYTKLRFFSDNKIKFFLFPQVRESTGCTTLGLNNLGLLSRSSCKQVKEALKQSQSPEIVSQYLLAWQCFKEVQRSVSVNIAHFQLETFQQIANLYNLRVREQENFHGMNQLKGETIRDWLEEIGRAIRRLLEPQSISLNYQLGEDGTLIDALPFDSNFGKELIEIWERNQTKIVLKEFVDNLLAQIENIENRQILFLRYGFDVSQSEIAKESNKDQATISRKLNFLHKKIFKEISNWGRQNIGIETNSECLNEIKVVISQYYSEQIDRITIDAIKRLEERRQKILKLFYVTGATKVEIAQNLELSEAKFEEEFDAIAQQLHQYTAEQITTEIQLCFQSQAVINCIPALVESRLPAVLQQLDKN